MSVEEIRNRIHWALTFGNKIPMVRKIVEVQRDLLLRSIELCVEIYDPSPPRRAALEPDLKAYRVELDHYEVIGDDFLRAPRGSMKAITIENEHIVRSSLGFSYQPWAEPRLRTLRERYSLDAVIGPGASEFEQMVRLRNWGRSQWKRSDWQPRLPDFDILAILERDHRNTDGRENDKSVNYTPCSFFPPQYIQLLLALGHQARYVSISHESVEFHGMTEVWSNQHRKWITMDADLNLYYQKDGVPLNLLEVHNLRYLDDPLGFEMVREPQDSGDDEWKKPLADKDFFLSYHTYFRTELRNDWLTNRYFRGHPGRSEQATLYFHDPRLEPPRPWSRISPVTSRVQDFYWTLNQVEIHTRRHQFQCAADCLALLFRTVTPNFSSFEITLDENTSTSSSSPLFDWKLHQGENSLTVRSINQAGLRGIPSRIVINYQDT